LASPILSTKYR